MFSLPKKKRERKKRLDFKLNMFMIKYEIPKMQYKRLDHKKREMDVIILKICIFLKNLKLVLTQ